MSLAEVPRSDRCDQVSPGTGASAVVRNAINGQWLKRGLDVVVSVASLVALTPLLLLIAAVVWTIDGRPVLFGHTRIGRDGRAFRCLKFRTMVRDADERLEAYLRDNPAARSEWDTNFKLWNDPRIIPGIGEFLRSTSLDELPQLWNVLVGDMSLVGPRPVTEAELHLYGASASAYLSVRPGLTGAWQVSGRSTVTYDQRVRMDADYAYHRTFLLDLKILLATVFVVIGRQGAV